jgi:hypothetical protein
MHKNEILKPEVHYSIDCTVAYNSEPILLFYRLRDKDRYEIKYHKPSAISYSYLKCAGFQYWEPKYPKYLLSWLNVHENQYLAGRDVIEYYQSGIKDVILVAQMQSGKTGTASIVLILIMN